MSFISVTRLRIRLWRFLPSFFLHTTRTRRQVMRAPGFKTGSLLLDRKWVFWTLTAWESEAAMRAYMTTGDHRTAMPRLINWCDEASVAHWVQDDDTLPSWADAETRMRSEGRASKLRHPSLDHAALTFAPARLTGVAPIHKSGDSGSTCPP